MSPQVAPQAAVAHGMKVAARVLVALRDAPFVEPAEAERIAAAAGLEATGFSRVDLQALVDHLARLKTEEEFGDDGMSGDDAVSTLSSFIEQARHLSDHRPAPRTR